MSREESILSLNAKSEISRIVLKDAFSKFLRPAIIWNADRDSNILLDMVSKVTEKMGLRFPPTLFIDHGDHFPETQKMVDELSKDRNFRVLTVKNQNALDTIKENKITVSNLSDANKNAMKKFGIEADDIPYTMDDPRVQRLFCLVPLFETLTRYRFDSIITSDSSFLGIENPSQLLMQPHKDPYYTSVHPLIMFTEQDLWRFTFENEIPVHPKYKEGYRNVTCTKCEDNKGDRPPWETYLEDTENESVSEEDKDRMIERLRALGYM